MLGYANKQNQNGGFKVHPQSAGGHRGHPPQRQCQSGAGRVQKKREGVHQEHHPGGRGHHQPVREEDPRAQGGEPAPQAGQPQPQPQPQPPAPGDRSEEVRWGESLAQVHALRGEEGEPGADAYGEEQRVQGGGGEVLGGGHPFFCPAVEVQGEQGGGAVPGGADKPGAGGGGVPPGQVALRGQGQPQEAARAVVGRLPRERQEEPQPHHQALPGEHRQGAGEAGGGGGAPAGAAEGQLRLLPLQEERVRPQPVPRQHLQLPRQLLRGQARPERQEEEVGAGRGGGAQEAAPGGGNRPHDEEQGHQEPPPPPQGKRGGLPAEGARNHQVLQAHQLRTKKRPQRPPLQLQEEHLQGHDQPRPRRHRPQEHGLQEGPLPHPRALLPQEAPVHPQAELHHQERLPHQVHPQADLHRAQQVHLGHQRHRLRGLTPLMLHRCPLSILVQLMKLVHHHRCVYYQLVDEWCTPS